jgi:hypothetical protein
MAPVTDILPIEPVSGHYGVTLPSRPTPPTQDKGTRIDCLWHAAGHIVLDDPCVSAVEPATPVSGAATVHPGM